MYVSVNAKASALLCGGHGGGHGGGGNDALRVMVRVGFRMFQGGAGGMLENGNWATLTTDWADPDDAS